MSHFLLPREVRQNHSIIREMKNKAIKILLILLVSSNLFASPFYGEHTGLIRLNGYPIGIEQFLYQGYPNSINQFLLPPKTQCHFLSDVHDKLDKDTDRDDDKNQKVKIDTEQTISQEDLEKSYDAKKELEENLSTANNTFEDPDIFFRSITDEPPPNCRYKLRGFTQREV